jgi:thymidylate kinase
MGKLIVIEGADHIGKSSIIKNVEGYLKEIEKKSVKVMKFPNPENSYIQDYLNGDLDMTPEEVSKIFADDRRDSAHEIFMNLDKYDYVILDRYVLSNLLYQCGSIYQKTKSAFLMFDLITTMIAYEYDLNNIPQPNMTLFIRREAVIPTDFDNDDVLETNIELQQFVNKNADNPFFMDRRHGVFKLLEADYLDNIEVEQLIIGAIING